MTRLRYPFDPKELIRQGCLFWAPLLNPHGAKTIISQGVITGDTEEPSTETVDSDGTLTNPDDGLIDSAATGIARIERAGARIEPTGINNWTKSAELTDTSAWPDGPTGPDRTPNTAVAPDGTTTADTIGDSNAAAFEEIRRDFTISDDSTWWTSSFYYKKDSDTTRFPEITLTLNGGTSQTNSIQLNTQTGAITTRASTGTVNSYVVGFDGFWRLVVGVKNNSLGNTNARLFFYPAVTASFGSAQVAATGTVIAWGGQLENNPWATSIIPTDTVAATRSADVLAFPSSQNILAASGSFGFAITTDFDGADLVADVYAFDFSDGSDGIRGFFDQSNSGKLTVEVLSASTTVATLVAAAAPTRGTTTVHFVKWQANDFALYTDGAQDATDTSGAAPTAIGSSIFVGSDRSSANQLGGLIASPMAFGHPIDDHVINGISQELLRSVG